MRTAAHGPRGLSSKAGVDWDPFYFFLIAVGYKVPWTAISSLLHQFNQQFQQPKVLLWLNLAYFLPSMPALLLHSSLQDLLERKLGVPKAAMARFTVGLGGLVALCLAFPACSSTLTSLLALTAAVGVTYSIAFGTSHQLVPRFTQRSTVALNTGFVSCGVVILLADLLLKRNAANYTPAALQRLFQVAAAQTLIGLLAAFLLLQQNWRRLESAGRQQQHHVIGLVQPTGGGMFGRSGPGSNGSNGSSRQLLLPPRSGSWGTGHVAGGVGFRHVSHQPAQHTSTGFSGHGAAPSSGTTHWESSSYCSSSSACSSTSSAAGISVHVTVSSDDDNGTGGPGSQPGPTSQVPSSSFRDPRWDHSPRKRHSGGSSSSKQGWLMRHLQPLLLLLQLAWRIWPAWLALLMSVGSSMLVFPLFTCVGTNGRLGDRLPQILFYARLLGDILGRMVPPSWQLRSSKALLSAAFLKTKLLVVLVPGILQPSLVGGDLCLAALVTINWWLSGYINTSAYLLAPRLATLELSSDAQLGVKSGLQHGKKRGSGFGRWLRFWGSSSRARLASGKDHGGSTRRDSSGLERVGSTALRSKAGAVMSFCFQTSCFLGLMGAWLVQEILHENEHPAFAGAGKAAGVAAAATAAAMRLRGAATGVGVFGRSPVDAAAAAAVGPDGGVTLDGLSEMAASTATGGNTVGAAAAAAAFAAAAAVASGSES